MRPFACFSLTFLLSLGIAAAQDAVPAVPAAPAASAGNSIAGAVSKVGAAASAAVPATAAASIPTKAATHPAGASSWQGQWKLNVEQSHLAGAAPKSAVLLCTTDTPADFRWTSTIVDAAGQKKLLSFTGARDGSGFPVSGDPGIYDLSYTLEPDGIHGETRHKNGTIDEEVDTISPDGKLLTRKITSTTAAGEKTSWTEVYEKVS